MINSQPVMTTMSGAAGASPPSAEMMEMLHFAQELAHDGTVQGTLKALELVTDIIRETRPGGENAVMQALKEAKNNHQRVVASSTRPDSSVDGTNWVLLCECVFSLPSLPLFLSLSRLSNRVFQELKECTASFHFPQSLPITFLSALTLCRSCRINGRAPVERFSARRGWESICNPRCRRRW